MYILYFTKYSKQWIVFMFMGVGMFCYLAVCSGAEDILPARVNCY